jgi:replicative DNA helicase
MHSAQVINFSAFSGKVPPQSTEAEEALLGGLLLDGKAIERVVSLLRPEAFYTKAHRNIYKAALTLYRQDDPIDLMTVSSWLADNQLLEGVGGQNKLAELVDRTISSANADRYAMLIMEKYQRRKLIEISNQAIELAHDATDDFDNQLEVVQSRLFELADSRRTESEACQHIGDILPAVFSEIEEANAGEDASFPAIPTGFYDIDAMTGGLPLGSVTVVSGRTGMGKSTWAIELGLQAALGGIPVVYFSLEMPKAQISKKILGRMGAPKVPQEPGLPTERLFRRNGLKEEDWGTLSNAMGEASGLPLWVQDASSPTIADIRRDLRLVQGAYGSVGMAIIDYVGLMRGEKSANRAAELDGILADLRAIAKDLNISLVALAQINREAEKKSNKRPSLAEIRESGAYEQEAALLFGLYNDSYYNPDSPDRGIMEILLLKNRFGRTGSTKLLFQPEYGRFLNLAGGRNAG